MDEDFRALEFTGGALRLIDQRLLPGKLEYIDCTTAEEVAEAIRSMIVRGAPAIGGAAAYGVYLALLEAGDDRKRFGELAAIIRSSRPTAVNLMWAVDRMTKKAESTGFDPEALKAEADCIVEEDICMNHALSEHGVKVLRDGDTILTHCNAGALATCGWGTALGVIKEAHRRGMGISVFADETRPLLQGARLTEPSLRAMGIRCFLITDAMGAHFMAEGRIDRFMTASDLVLSDRTVVNKTGTLSDAIAASFYGIPYYAFSLSIDREVRRDAIIMESRDGWGEEGFGARMLYPLFDMIPPDLVTGIITKDGVI